MKKNGKISWLLIMVLPGIWQGARSQEMQPYNPLVVSVFNNATLLPGGGELGIFGIPVHPGIALGTEFRYNKSQKNEWFQTVKLGYHYHRYVQHGLRFYSEIGYRRHFKGRLDVGPQLGVGYLQSIPAKQIFEWQPDETAYLRTGKAGRPQFMATMALEVGYDISRSTEPPMRVFLAYQFYLQMPFVQEYVPLMPNTALHAGLSIPLTQN